MLSLEVAQRLRGVADSGLHQLALDHGDQAIAAVIAVALVLGVFGLALLAVLWIWPNNER